ncbi:S-adenosyl-methyltransferase MraW [Luminiphilus syltensis NOR5-1B]|uniref:Ribosomal RNA small subunit methyltransferase H n=1 Tax=Luminiphilus syltensis NOR5-1B TaxID=565045 RepID=B8KR59_9GAMM|nr:16S rRNA (cytosine(1402)-N(4))-methyltransferase RsmH [Luminiphilus syltensis]EED34496.1 S-adenosyl-methyltransferase MraW [Luminiphilus syltensis NOR5-1B]
MASGHRSVLLEEAVTALITTADGTYVDGTYGRGGHSRRVLAALSEAGRLIGFDKDPEAAVHAEDLAATDSRFSFFHRSFADIPDIKRPEQGFSGVLLDLGVSSPQLDNGERGFSFQSDGPLDMRMDSSSGVTAAVWINKAPLAELIQVFRDYGEERFATRIANAIIDAREETPIERTGRLAQIVKVAHPRWEPHKHPATRVFQAIRIFINRELEDLESVLVRVIDTLDVGGRLVVISFHSLEDRIVKRFMRDESRGVSVPRGVPIRDADMGRRLRVVGKAVKPSTEELANNPRARSAVMRVAERLA